MVVDNAAGVLAPVVADGDVATAAAVVWPASSLPWS